MQTTAHREKIASSPVPFKHQKRVDASWSHLYSTDQISWHCDGPTNHLDWKPWSLVSFTEFNKLQ